MKNSLSKTELTGLILLALLIVAITGCALLTRGCGEEKIRQEIPAVEIFDTDTSASKEVSSVGKKQRRKPSKKKKRKASVKQQPVKRNDPFKDTVPMAD